MPDPRLDPPHPRPSYAVRGPLVRRLSSEARRAHDELGAYRVLDVGRGRKPYEPLFAPYAGALRRPGLAVRELRRVTGPGRRVLASTHGIMPYDPSPTDDWRWTHAGLAKLFADNADWESVRVTPASGTTACVGMIVAMNLELMLRRLRAGRPSHPLVTTINRVAGAIGNRSPRLREPTNAGTLFANFHVVAAVPR